MLLNKKEKIISLIYVIKPGSISFSKRIEYFSFSLICIVPFVYTIITGTSNTCGFNINNSYLNVLASITNAFSFAVTYPTTTNVVVFIYCSFCSRMCQNLRRSTTQIKNCSPNDFDVIKRVTILRKKDKLDYAFQDMHSIFSVPLFCVLVAHFCFCCALLGWVLLGKENVTNVK